MRLPCSWLLPESSPRKVCVQPGIIWTHSKRVCAQSFSKRSFSLTPWYLFFSRESWQKQQTCYLPWKSKPERHVSPQQSFDRSISNVCAKLFNQESEMSSFCGISGSRCDFNWPSSGCHCETLFRSKEVGFTEWKRRPSYKKTGTAKAGTVPWEGLQLYPRGICEKLFFEQSKGEGKTLLPCTIASY